MKTKECTHCHAKKFLSEFSIKSKKLGGGIYSLCKGCIIKVKEKRNKLISNTKHNQIDLNQPLELKFLLDINGWSKDEIKLFLLTVQKYKSPPERMKNSTIFKRYFCQRSSWECSRLLKEFVEVAKHGINFEDYMKTDRKFRRDGKRVLVPAKK